MAYAVVAGGSSLYTFYPDGSSTALTLPKGVAVAARPLRGAVLDRNVVLVNAPTSPLWLDDQDTLRLLTLRKPHAAPTVAAGAAGSLSGTFAVKMSFAIKDSTGRVVQEGPLSEASANVTVSSQLIALSAIATSGAPGVNCRRFYRTTTGPGESYFHWFDLDDNTTTSISEQGSDESLPTDAVDEDTFGSAPSQIELIAEWKGRLWAKSVSDPDTLFGTEEKLLYAWTLEFVVGPKGRDGYGITGFLPRRDELGVARREILWKLTGSDEDDFRLVKVAEGIGVLAPDTCIVIHDTGYFLGLQYGQIGVFEWNSSGVRNISDDEVFPWFNTDTYFNRGELKNAFARYNPATNAYEIFVAAVGGTTINRWVSFGIKDRRWLGPHVTSAFNPTCGALLHDSNEIAIGVVGGSDGKVYQRTDTRTDGASTAISLDARTNLLLGEPPTPDIEKYFGELGIVTKKESGGTLTITPTIRTVDASGDEVDTVGAAINHTLTKGRQRLRRIGTGRGVKFKFEEATAGQDVEVYGAELPWHELGRR